VIGSRVIKKLVKEAFQSNINLGEAEFITYRLDFSILQCQFRDLLGTTDTLANTSSPDSNIDIPDIFSFVDSSCFLRLYTDTYSVRGFAVGGIGIFKLLSRRKL